MEGDQYGKSEYRSEHTTTTTTTTTTGVSIGGCPPAYLITPFGILKIVELVLTILTFALSLGGWWSYNGGGWVEFVSISCFITTAIWFILHLLNVIPRLPNIFVTIPIEFISFVVMAILLLIAALVAAANARGNGPVGACAFFCFAAVVAYAVDCFFLFRDWKSGTGGTMAASSSAQSTTATTTHY